MVGTSGLSMGVAAQAEHLPCGADPTIQDGIDSAALLDALLAQGSSQRRIPAAEDSWRRLIEALRERAMHPDGRGAVVRMLSVAIARLDESLCAQVNVILHDPRFQGLEASWRGLRYVVDEAAHAEDVRIRVLNVSWQEVGRDARRAVEFDQSELFKKVYDGEFGMAGGHPFGVLLGDYRVTHHPDDVDTLRAVTQVAAAAFAPFITGAAPQLLGLRSFTELEQPLDLGRTFEQPEYLGWRRLRESEDARFLGVTLPRVLLRRPYADGAIGCDGFRFSEETASLADYLWGNAAYCFVATLVRAFASSQWLADIRGVRRSPEGGLQAGAGLVGGLPVDQHPTDAPGVAPKSCTEVLVTEAMDKDLGQLGLIPLCHCQGSEHAAFYSNASLHRPQPSTDPLANSSDRMSSMLQYMLCASRFAHYLKAMARDKQGAFDDARDWNDLILRWLSQYTVDDANAAPEVKARYPLRKSEAQVRSVPGRPGVYACTVHLVPHYQLDGLSGSIVLRTELAAAGR